ncbi:MAG: hypothetical protein FJ189_07880 [Gammaproteobacteria bacterium]|nr:hypothetical protein [Gammaproteobacteria bacterium]
MDPRIRSLIVSHGGYTHEIAGCVVAFFSDPRQSRMLGGFLTHIAQVAVERCGSQLSFPASARLTGPVPAAIILDANEAQGARRESEQWPLFRRPPTPRPPTTEAALPPPQHGPRNWMRTPAASTPRNLGLFKRV